MPPTESAVSASFDYLPSASFPKKPDFMLTSDDLDKRRLQLENYLNATLQLEEYRNHSAMLEFLEVSEFSFVEGLIKDKEGLVKKRVGDNENAKWFHRLSTNIQYICLCFTR